MLDRGVSPPPAITRSAGEEDDAPHKKGRRSVLTPTRGARRRTGKPFARLGLALGLTLCTALALGLSAAVAAGPNVPYDLPVTLPSAVTAPSVDATAPYTPAVLSLIAQMEASPLTLAQIQNADTLLHDGSNPSCHNVGPVSGPVALGASGSPLNTSLSLAGAAGDTVLRVGNATGFSVGDKFYVDTYSSAEYVTASAVQTGGSSTLSAATAAGDTTVRVGNVTNFAAGQSVIVDTGASQESATVSAVGAGGSTTLGLPAAVGDTVIKVPSVSTFAVGNLIYLDTGANLESATIASIPANAAGASTVRTATAAGATVVPVVSSTGFAVGGTITIDSGANLETATVTATAGGGSPSVTVSAPLTLAHAVGVQVSGPGITLSAPLAKAHASGAIVYGTWLTFAAPLTLAHASGAAVSGSLITISAPLAAAHSSGALVYALTTPSVMKICWTDAQGVLNTSGPNARGSTGPMTLMGLGATFDRSLGNAWGQTEGQESREFMVTGMFGPQTDLDRHPQLGPQPDHDR